MLYCMVVLDDPLTSKFPEKTQGASWVSVGKESGIIVRDTLCSNDLARVSPMSHNIAGIPRITSCPLCRHDSTR